MLAAFWMADQTQTAQHPVDRHHGQGSSFSRQQLGQLPRPPVRTLSTQLRYPLLQHGRRASGAVVRTMASLFDPRNTLLLEPTQPQITGRTADLVLPAKSADRLSPAGPNHKLHSAIPHTPVSPAHPQHLDGVKDLLITMCKGSPDTEHAFCDERATAPLAGRSPARSRPNKPVIQSGAGAAFCTCAV